MRITLENLRNLLYSSPLDNNLFKRWCLLNYFRDIYEQTGCMGPEYEYISGFYPSDEYDVRHFFGLYINSIAKIGTLNIYKHLSYTTYYAEGNFCHYDGREIYYEDVDWFDARPKILFFNPLEVSECKPFDLEEAKEKMKAEEIIIFKDSCEVHYLNGSTNIECFSKKTNGGYSFSEGLKAQNPLLAKYFKGKGASTKSECYMVDMF
jgi:hypothetical protein